MTGDPQALVRRIVAALEDIKGRDIRVLDVRGLTEIADFMVIASATSDRHARAVATRVIDTLREEGVRPIGSEGEGAADWILIDYGDVIVHVMQERTRAFYDLEKLWGEEFKGMIAARREEAGE